MACGLFNRGSVDYVNVLPLDGGFRPGESYGRWKDAEKLRVQVMEVRRTRLCAHHPDTQLSMVNLASMLTTSGQNPEGLISF
jgi:hypothetical protein